MKNRMKWFRDENELGIQMSPTLGTCSSSSKIEAETLKKVGNKEEHALKLCNVSPPSNYIMNLAPYLSMGSKIVGETKLLDTCFVLYFPSIVFDYAFPPNTTQHSKLIDIERCPFHEKCKTMLITYKQQTTQEK